MNEYDYINETIAREASYNEGYEAGKAAAAESILDEIETLAYAVGEKSTIQIFQIRKLLDELRKKYEVK